jgi:hypothetical protein
MIARFRSQATINCAGQTAPTKSQLITISLATHFGTHARYRFVSQKIARRPAMAASGPAVLTVAPNRSVFGCAVDA